MTKWQWQRAAVREMCLGLVRRFAPPSKRRRERSRVQETFRRLERRKLNRGAVGDGAATIESEMELTSTMRALGILYEGLDKLESEYGHRPRLLSMMADAPLAQIRQFEAEISASLDSDASPPHVLARQEAAHEREP